MSLNLNTAFFAKQGWGLGHSRQLKKSEKGLTGRINKGKRVLLSKFCSFIIFWWWLIWWI